MTLRVLTMWASTGPGLIRVAVCPVCAALVPAERYSDHEQWHAEAKP